jgi:hypothetical protein
MSATGRWTGQLSTSTRNWALTGWFSCLSPRAERARRHAPVPVDRILHNIDRAAGALLTG